MKIHKISAQHYNQTHLPLQSRLNNFYLDELKHITAGSGNISSVWSGMLEGLHSELRLANNLKSYQDSTLQHYTESMQRLSRALKYSNNPRDQVIRYAISGPLLNNMQILSFALDCDSETIPDAINKFKISEQHLYSIAIEISSARRDILIGVDESLRQSTNISNHAVRDNLFLEHVMTILINKSSFVGIPSIDIFEDDGIVFQTTKLSSFGVGYLKVLISTYDKEAKISSNGLKVRV